ncbi:hypothetical protein K9N50_00100 [bacterium]|nr:hypothetical protein [bacterium]
MPVYEESGLRITLPDGASFRIQELQTYIHLKGKNLREMDYCWFDIDRNRINLLEVKNYSMHSFQEDDLTIVLLEKTIDTLFLLCATWLNTPKGSEIRGDIPEDFRIYDHTKKIRVFHVIKTNHTNLPLLHPIKDELNRLLSGKLTLLNIPRVILADHNSAIRIGLPITLL